MNISLAEFIRKPFRIAFQRYSKSFCLVFCLIVCTYSSNRRLSAQTEEIPQIIAELSADTFAMRQSAMQQLIQIGFPVIEHIERSIQDGEPEMRMRAMAVLQRLAVGRDLEAQTAAQETIQRMAESDDIDIRRLARRTISRMGDVLQGNAITELRRLGAEVVSQVTSTDGRNYVAMHTITIPEEWKGTREDLKLLMWVRDINTLTLVGQQIDDNVIDLISGKDQLQSLFIKRASITNASVKTLAKIKSLVLLQFVYCKINDDCLPDLEKHFHLSTLYLYGTDVSREVADGLANKLNITVDYRKGAFLGVYYNRSNDVCEITRVVDGSSADIAGIQANDVIAYFDGKKIDSGNDFQGAVSQFNAGDKIAVTVIRDGKEVELQVELGRFMDSETLR